MKTLLLEIQSIEPVIWFFWILGAIITLAVFYYLIKGAVKNGMIEADAVIKGTKTEQLFKSEQQPPNADQILLQARYDKGEITFDEYQKEWIKIVNL